MAIYVDVLCLILSMCFGIGIMDAISSNVSLNGSGQWRSVGDALLALFDILALRVETPFYASFIAGALIVITIGISLSNFDRIKNRRQQVTARIVNEASRNYIRANKIKQEDDSKK